MRHRFLTAVLVAFLIAGCTQSAPSDLITSFGEFPSPSGNFVLKVEKKEVSLVVGTILGSAGTKVFSETIGSDAMVWCFYWSQDGSLWAYSSDTGYLKQIAPNGRSSAKVRVVSKGEKLPPAMFDSLSESERAIYTK
ncbi:MAG: hypothetical protein ABI273_15735 [Lacunisphaera sp.]